MYIRSQDLFYKVQHYQWYWNKRNLRNESHIVYDDDYKSHTVYDDDVDFEK